MDVVLNVINGRRFTNEELGPNIDTSLIIGVSNNQCRSTASACQRHPHRHRRSRCSNGTEEKCVSILIIFSVSFRFFF